MQLLLSGKSLRSLFSSFRTKIFDLPIRGLGCTLYCLAFGTSPFESPREGVLKLAILNAKYSTPPLRNATTAGGLLGGKECLNGSGAAFSIRFLTLIDKMLQLRLEDRPFMPEIISECEDILRALLSV